MDFTVGALGDIGKEIAQRAKHIMFGTKAQLGFLEDFYLLINDGIPANRAIEMMSKVTTGLNREVALSIGAKISQGSPLADGMSEWFSPNVTEIIRVGEAGGALAQTVKSAVNSLSQRGVAIGSFVGALAYPLLVITIASAVIVYLDTTVFIQFRAIKPEDQWPEAGRRLVAIAGFIKHWWWVVILSLIAFGIAFGQFLAKYTGELRPWLDQYPPFTLYRKLVAARLLETLGLLVANGVVFKSALRVMQYQANPYVLSHLVQMERLLSTGKSNIGDVLATGLVNQDDLMRLKVMAEVKGFEHGLIRMGIRGTDSATATLKVISKILGGFFLILGGGLIIVIMQGIYLTGMSMAS